jgi:predicted enzyme related to lactoylglutathione lyase
MAPVLSSAGAGDFFGSPDGTRSWGEAMILGLRTAIYPVTDIVAAKDWYEKVLGQKPYFDEPFYVGFEVGGFELGLVPDGETSLAGARPLWGVDDAKAELSRLLALGATPCEDVTDVGSGIRVAAVRDPFGNRFGIIENPNFDLARVR